jgi:glycine hydroxymethyltransferase
LTAFDARSLADLDAELARALAAERERQESYLELIASENYVSPRVLAAQGSLLTNKYADGYPGHRHYAGCEQADVAEQLAIDRARRLFGAGYANVQPYSGSSANLAVYLALLEPGDTLLGMRPAHGGHRTHGAAENISGKLYRAVFYDVDATTGAASTGRDFAPSRTTCKLASSPTSRTSRGSSRRASRRIRCRSPT